ncbi:MAG TPA: UDP-N-acetylmuramate--L-alanine ligase, partial [Candidatus Omnitrophica bacterium]|nr:UDP-N-acetylmuramate--L-alanine ligase [Candidatus Omnitrophota bacterium]
MRWLDNKMEALKEIEKVHFIGIGGIGMSALAQLLIRLGYEVTGSDIRYTALVKKIEDMGAKVFISHSPTNIKDVNLVVYSSSISQDNVELVEDKRRGICVKSRGRLLAELMNDKKGIAICGTHGKTT